MLLKLPPSITKAQLIRFFSGGRMGLPKLWYQTNYLFTMCQRLRYPHRSVQRRRTPAYGLDTRNDIPTRPTPAPIDSSPRAQGPLDYPRAFCAPSRTTL